MKYTKIILLAGLALATATARLTAAEDISWTGYYIGLNSGYSFGNSDAKYAFPDFSSYSIQSHPDGGTVGFQVGANYEFKNHLVAGLEAEISYTDVSDTIYDSLSDAHGRPGNTIKTSSDYPAPCAPVWDTPWAAFCPISPLAEPGQTPKFQPPTVRSPRVTFSWDGLPVRDWNTPSTIIGVCDSNTCTLILEVTRGLPGNFGNPARP